MTTAHKHAIDRLRRESRGRELLSEVAVLSPGNDLGIPEDVGFVQDDRLRLIFTCCHPGTLHGSAGGAHPPMFGGLSTTEIARSFLVAELTMAQRLVRAKRKIKAARIPYPRAGGGRQDKAAAISAAHVSATTGPSQATETFSTMPSTLSGIGCCAGPRTEVRLRLRPRSVARFPTMDTATEYSAPIHTWFDLLVEIRELEGAGLVAVSIDEGAEFRVELTSRGYEYLGRDPKTRK
jgi:hypothetical protein